MWVYISASRTQATAAIVVMVRNFTYQTISSTHKEFLETPILSNLTLTDHLDSIEVTWESETFQRCSEEYIVNLYVNFELESTVTTGEFKHVFNHETEPCNLIMIELIAVVNGISGSTISKNYEPGMCALSR